MGLALREASPKAHVWMPPIPIDRFLVSHFELVE